MHYNTQYRWLIGAILFGWLAQASADLVYTSPPREGGGGGDKAANPHEPVVAYLSKVLGQKVVYSNPGNWLNYQKQMREDKYDIVFDGPHFISWRIAHTSHEALARLPGPLDFVLVAKSDDTSINKVEDLVAKSFCGIAPPNLGTMVILDKFRNPVRQPVVVSISGGVPEVYDAFMKGRCDAATLRSNFYVKKLKDEERKQLKVIFKSAPLPNQGFSVGKRVSAGDREKLKQALLSPDAVKPLDGLIKAFGKPDDKIIPTDNKEYEGFNTLLEGVVFGWE